MLSSYFPLPLPIEIQEPIYSDVKREGVSQFCGAVPRRSLGESLGAPALLCAFNFAV